MKNKYNFAWSEDNLRNHVGIFNESNKSVRVGEIVELLNTYESVVRVADNILSDGKMNGDGEWVVPLLIIMRLKAYCDAVKPKSLDDLRKELDEAADALADDVRVTEDGDYAILSRYRSAKEAYISAQKL